jgi:hypothetical protein
LIAERDFCDHPEVGALSAALVAAGDSPAAPIIFAWRPCRTRFDQFGAGHMLVRGQRTAAISRSMPLRI